MHTFPFPTGRRPCYGGDSEAPVSDSPTSRSFLFCLNKTSVKSGPCSAPDSAVAPISLGVKAKVWTMAHGSRPCRPLGFSLNSCFAPSPAQSVSPGTLAGPQTCKTLSFLRALALADPSAWNSLPPGVYQEDELTHLQVFTQTSPSPPSPGEPLSTPSLVLQPVPTPTYLPRLSLFFPQNNLSADDTP